MAEPLTDIESLRRTNESLTRELLAAYEELDLVHTLSSIFATSSDVDEMGERLVGEAVEALAASAGFLAFTGEGMEEFDPVLRDIEAEEVQAFVRIAAPQILKGDPLLLDNAIAEGFDPRPLLAVPLRSRDGIFGVIGLMRPPGGDAFTAGDEKALTVLAIQASSVILQKRNLDLTFLSESLKRSNEGLQALLEISRELTSTLDVNRVLAAIVNLPGKVVAFDRASIALKQGNRWRLRAVSAQARVDRAKPEIRDLETLLGWVGDRGDGIAVESGADGEPKVERAETAELFRGHFRRSGMASFFSLVLADDEGSVGVFAVERATGLCPSERAREVLTVLANQATVALRNAQLYQQVPLISFLEPMLQRSKRFTELRRGRQLAWAVGVAGIVAALLFVPMPLRVGGNTLLAPVRTVSVSAAVPGRVASVELDEGQRVTGGQVVARLDDREYRQQLGESRARAEVADRRVRQLEASNNPRAAAVERAQLDRLRAEVALAEANLAETLLRAPEDGFLLTARVRELAGRRLEAGQVFCSLAALSPLEAEVSVPESEIRTVEPGQKAELKLNAYPDRVFYGEVTAVRPAAEERDGATVVIAHVLLENPELLLRPGMRGRGRIKAGKISLGHFLFRRPVRWILQWFWF